MRYNNYKVKNELDDEQDVQPHIQLLLVAFYSNTVGNIGIFILVNCFLTGRELRPSKPKISLQESNFNGLTRIVRQVRQQRYKYELLDRATDDILDKALVKVKMNMRENLIDAPTYYKTIEKINSLKKL